MIKPIAVLCVVLSAQCQAQQYVWDLLKPPLTAGEVRAIAFNAYAADTFPMYASIPQTNFRCKKKKQPGFYADTEAQCQVFHRCDVNGNQTSYLCVNSTVFNQVTLVCDYFYNVDCEKFATYEDFANSRLYTDRPLFDTPPSNYVPPGARLPGFSFASSERPAKQRSTPITTIERLKMLQNTPFGNKMA